MQSMFIVVGVVCACAALAINAIDFIEARTRQYVAPFLWGVFVSAAAFFGGSLALWGVL